MTMMKTIKKLLIFLMLALPVAVAADYLFKTLEARDGLTSSQVNCILKDSRGYMWFGTPAGLYRFDGYTFRNFQSDSQNGSSLNDSYINSIQETLDGNLLIETAQGYCIYHPQTESFERDMKQAFARFGIETIPSVVYVDKHKNLWGAIPNKGVVCYNQQQQTLHEFGYTDDSKGVPQGVVCSISECKEGALIVYDDGKIACCDVMHQQNTLWVVEGIPALKDHNTKSLRAYADENENIWLYGQGTLVMYNRKKGEWDYSVSQKLGVTGLGVDRNINGMAGNAGSIWIGSDQLGLLRMDPNTHEIESVQPRNINEKQLITDNISIQSLYMDDTGLLWVGTEKSGVAYTGKYIYRFGSDLMGDVTAMAQHADGSIWYGTSDKGVIGFNGQLASLKVSCMSNTPDGSIWIGSKRNGLTRIKDGVTTYYSSARDSMKSLIDDHINALCADKTGNLWIATNGGLQVYSPKMNTFSSYTRENGMLNTNNITSLYYGTDNNLLIGTAEGMIILNLSTRKKTVLTGNTTNLLSFTNNYITQVHEDSRGLIWIGTREGINILNPESDELYYVTETDGLCNNSICGIAEDKSGSIWVTTSNGISRIVVQRNHEDGTFAFGLYNYSTNDGLQSNEFNMGAILSRNQSGKVIFGGLYGINWVREGAKDDQETLPRVMLTQLFIGEEEIMTGHAYDNRVILTSALNESSKIELKNSQNTFTIKFAAGNYNKGERLQFMYWMEGRDNDWRNGDAMLHGVKFQNLSSGDYTLHVKAVSADGAVSNQERKLDITIDRPWWLSWWMLTLYVIIAIVALVIWRYGIGKVKHIWMSKKAVIEELKRQREEIKLASDDLRQPMARMTTIIGGMAENEQTLEGREQLNSLHFQLLQVITRISEMQSVLENPEKQATSSAKDRLELNDKGQVALAYNVSNELAIDVKPLKVDSQAKKFAVVLIDDNREFLNFMNAHLRDVYNFHAYATIKEALPDIETLNADLVICKQNLTPMTGSELCTQFKMDSRRSKTKFVLLTDGVLTQQDMTDQNITLAADDYLAKPFNVQEAVMRFNKLMGLGPLEMNQDVIEGSETRMIEGRNASMTTATMVYEDLDELKAKHQGEAGDEEQETTKEQQPIENASATQNMGELMHQKYYGGNTIGDYSMSESMDQQLMRNVEQFVLQNMSRGQISLEEMATAMGMGRVPFFHKIRSITTKTPAEVVRDIRLKHACTLLVSTNVNMSELAINIGFKTAENFVNIFKEKFGMTPLEYRLKNKK